MNCNPNPSSPQKSPCRRHRNYRAIRLPSADCTVCRAFYIDKHGVLGYLRLEAKRVGAQIADDIVGRPAWTEMLETGPFPRLHTIRTKECQNCKHWTDPWIGKWTGETFGLCKRGTREHVIVYDDSDPIGTRTDFCCKLFEAKR